MTSTYDNCLANAHHDKALLLSLWMNDPDQQRDYNDFAFRVSVKPLVVTPDLPPIPVMVDPATDRYLQDKIVDYVAEPYMHESTMTRRVRIVRVKVSGGADNAIVDHSWPEFLAKFLAFHHKKAPERDDDMDESDENEDEEPRRRKTRV